MSRDSLNIVLAVLSVVVLAAGGSMLMERTRSAPPPRKPSVAVVAGPGQRRVTLDVAGMTCASCAARITNGLEATPGVVACQLDAPAGRAIVVCGESVDDSSLVRAVTSAGRGFTATILAR